jgi:SulP family sulfate permease
MIKPVALVRTLLPRRDDYRDLSATWRHDVVAGLTVAVVALPLALGFGITSGMGAASGLVTAVVAGLVAAVFGGSNVQVSGPTGAMTVVLVPLVARQGRDAVLTVGVMAGALILAAAIAGAGRYLAFVPWPVIEGFTVGIATIILLQQVPAALGVARPDGDNTLAVAVRAAWRSGSGGHWQAAALVALVVVVVLVTSRVRRSLPASLLAVAAATLTAELAHLDVARIGSLPSRLPSPALPSLAPGRLSELFGAAIAVAALAALESLLSAKVADGMSDNAGHDSNRELFGQGLANLVGPVFGGMPATGAIARTAVNVRAGARTRLSAIVHAFALLGVVMFAGPLISKVPVAALAGVLMVTATRMVERHNVGAVVRATRGDAAVFAATALGTIAFDLIVAIEIGLAVAAVLALRSVAIAGTATSTALNEGVDLSSSQHLLDEHILAYRLDGALFFGAAQRFLTELTNITEARVVILRMPDLQVLDATGAQALGEIISELEDRGITVLLKGTRPAHHRVLLAVGALERLAHERHMFDDFDAAIAHAREHVSRQAGGSGLVRHDSIVGT